MHFMKKNLLPKYVRLNQKHCCACIKCLGKNVENKKKKIKTDAEDIIIDQNNIIKIGKKITSRYPKFQYMGLSLSQKKTSKY